MVPGFFTISPKCWPVDNMWKTLQILMLTIVSLLATHPCRSATPAKAECIPVAAGFLLGGMLQGQWVNEEAIQASITAGLIWQRLEFDRQLSPLTGSAAKIMQEGCEFYAISFSDADADHDDSIKIAASHRLMPRLPRVQKGGLETYEKEVRQILEQNNLDAEAIIQQAVRIDLDGDGAEEVFIVAGNADYRAPVFRENSYTLVLFRRLVQGKVVTYRLYEQFYHEDREGEADSPSGYEVCNFADIDGDGVMEVFIRGRYYEGLWYDVYQLGEEGLKKIFSAGIGA